ncbi:MAG: glutamate synthase large subunit [Acidimicrobiales bacterium]
MPRPGRRRPGLYRPEHEHDACGIAFVADLAGNRSHGVLDLALGALLDLEHRGASGATSDVGDGSGVLLQLPDRFLREVAGVALPPSGCYAAGIVFLPRGTAASAVAAIEKLAASEDLAVLGWRDVPVDEAAIGEVARSLRPVFRQVFVAAPTVPAAPASPQAALPATPTAPRAGVPGAWLSGMELERQAFILRKRVEREVPGVHIPSLSARTMVYKGMLTTPQLPAFYRDLADERVETAIALVHSRFSTNTFPSWPLAHPYRLIAHNGEINTLRGNRNWMRAREALLETELLPGDIGRVLPVCTPGASDSATFDEVLELLHMAGRSLPHAVLMMVPEAWEHNSSMDEARRDFYRFHGSVMEPWDGPAAIAFTDGALVGAVLDRNGLRPGRYWVTSDGLVVLASEVGVIDVEPERVVSKGRLEPGKMFLVDTSAGRIVSDDEIKAELSAAAPYGQWLKDGLVRFEDLPERRVLVPTHASLVPHQLLFGYTTEELRVILAPMATAGAEPTGSMGNDAALAGLSERPRVLFDYFTQLFAQVTNPPLDAIREELVTSLSATTGPESNLLAPGPASCRQLVLPAPVIGNEELAKLLYINERGETPGFKCFAIDGLYPVAGGGAAMEAAIEEVRSKVSEAIAGGANIVVLSDRHSSAELAPIPSLLLTSAVHHHLIEEGSRTKAGLVVEAGDAREVHHFALLVGYGAAAVNPYLALDTVASMQARGALGDIDERTARARYLKAACKGILKVMSKMGISTIASYTGAQVFEAVGLGSDVVGRYFNGTPSRLGGVGLDVLAAEIASRHALAHSGRASELAHRDLSVGGEYQWRREGEVHLFNPETVFRLQHSTRSRRYDIFKSYTKRVDDQAEHLATLRGLLRLKTDAARAVPIDEVESAPAILRRFSTGAMSYGSISKEAHETLAVAMNRIGAKSNTGEGGEDPDRYVADPNGDSRRSAIKQVASARFGVTSEYLMSADDIQIKIAQGAKPGEGGQLPGYKVYPWIAATRHSTPGVGLISPPPHHDIYSIEDLAQLIHDLKCANRRARVHVKLVSEVGVGTIAAGVVKAKADVVLISGHDGGTGAAPLGSIKHAGVPWELGLAETQQTLRLNGLRDRVVLQTDGQLKTGRDVIVAALLGAEEYGFATAPLVVSGCIMMRVCHLDTCPVGIATQNPELRKRFTGRPEFVETFFSYIAEEVREHLASLGLRSLEDAIGRTDLLDVTGALDHYSKARHLDLSPVLAAGPGTADAGPTRCVSTQDHGLESHIDHRLIQLCRPALEDGLAVRGEIKVRNTDRAVGTMLGSEVTRLYGGAGLPEGTVDITLAGSAGQSLGAFLPAGITLRLLGDANDYVGKGLSGGRLVLCPPPGSPFASERNVIAGNVILYGATSGEAFIRGVVGERFCVRNSGATAVVEGLGDHGCEYMTGGSAVVLGAIGRNFGAGMSGGTAYLLAPDGLDETKVNLDTVDLDSPDESDLSWLGATIRRFVTETGSEVAGKLLASWPASAGAFVKVMPKDLRRVLAATALATEQGGSVEEAVMAAAHG